MARSLQILKEKRLTDLYRLSRKAQHGWPITNDLEIDAEVHFDCPGSFVNYVWTSTFDGVTIERYSSTDYQLLSIKKFDLNPGLNAICLKMYPNDQTDFFDQQDCRYITIAIPDPVAVMLEYDQNIVYLDDTLVLDASGSFDPLDTPETTKELKPGPLRYTWTCYRDKSLPVPSDLTHEQASSHCWSTQPKEIDFCDNTICQIHRSLLDYVSGVWYIFQVMFLIRYLKKTSF